VLVFKISASWLGRVDGSEDVVVDTGNHEARARSISGRFWYWTPL
jgi:hypothetical protein